MMLSEEQQQEIKIKVIDRYTKIYPDWTEIKITEIVNNVYFGIMVAVASNEFPDGEICLYGKDCIQVFSSTPELVRYLDMKAGRVISLKDWLTSIIVVVTLILFVSVALFSGNEQITSLILTAMAGILGTYAGANYKSDVKE